ncbi:RmlC-like cupin domain-containing protein [Kockovaella imperatae]|uniref:RmlC-like cupin domain-containing protein n=1 Tax=Kockovaella imperatae TaxID=4999 RepID=A0A1Y1U9J0_9TREE|nr:RmlC-like cupin domain-containing protein [Kockovaella imperatae]ORX34682.1 RmlC-like cupin domain-containing protein [Kockovaella imperatae]
MSSSATANVNATVTGPSSSSFSGPSRSVLKNVYADEVSEGIGARVRRSIGSRSLRNLSPFLMLDHFMIPKGAGFGDHPHRGQTTVTYILEGASEHEDSMGNRGTLRPGDVQWMTAGRGVVHAEMPLFDPDSAKAVPTRGFQLWIDRPQAQKFIEPSYQEKKAADIPTVKRDGYEISIISGESHDVKGFVRPVGGCWYFDVKLSKPGVKIHQPLPKGWTAFSGQLQIGDEPFPYDPYNLLVLSPDESGVTLTRPEKYSNGAAVDEETKFILVAGEPLNQRIVQYGPFVVNTAQQVQDAFEDFQEGKNGFESAKGWSSEIAKHM